MITVQCESCSKSYRFKPELVGKRVRCKSCGAQFTVVGDTARLSAGVDESVQQKKRKAKKKGGRHSKSNNRHKSSMTVIVSLVAVLLVVVVGVVLLNRGSRSVIDRERSTVANATDKVKSPVTDSVYQWSAKHSGYILAVAFAPNNHLLASLGDSGDLKFWDRTTGDPLNNLTFEKPNTAASIAFSSDGKSLAVGTGFMEIERATGVVTGSGRIELLDVSDVKNIERRSVEGVEFSSTVRALVYSPDGKTLAATSMDRIVLLDVVAGKVEVEFEAPDLVGADLVKVADSISVEILTQLDPVDPESVNRTVEGTLVLDSYRWKMAAAFAPDGEFLVTADGLHPPSVWNPSSGKLVRHLPQEDRVWGLCFTPDGSAIALWGQRSYSSFEKRSYTAGYPIPKQFNVESGELVPLPIDIVNGPRLYPAHMPVAYAPLGRYVASAMGPYLKFFDLNKDMSQASSRATATHIRLGFEEFPKTPVFGCVTFSPNGEFCAAGGFQILYVTNGHVVGKI